MKKLLLFLILSLPFVLNGQNRVVSLTLRGMVEKFVTDWNDDQRISFNIDLDGLEDGLKGFKRAVDNPTTLQNYVAINSINLDNTNFGRSFKLGVLCGITYMNVSGGWGGEIQSAEIQWNNWYGNQDINIHNTQDSILMLNTYLTNWFTDNLFNIATSAVNIKALNSGLFTVVDGEALIPHIFTTQQADWVRENCMLKVVNSNEYYTFDNYHWYLLVEQ
jgi:hypothetical protein